MVTDTSQVEAFFTDTGQNGGFFMMLPLFSAKSIPSFVKICGQLWLSIRHVVHSPCKKPCPIPPVTFIMAVIAEVFIGYILGFVSSIVLQSAQAAGGYPGHANGLLLPMCFSLQQAPWHP